ncbi:MAG: hypothetical protein AAB491_01840 [Patescibacteria group bacterium]
MKLSKIQIGIGLTKQIYNSFSAKEKKFWNDFFVLSEKEIKMAKETADTMPLIPSERLKKMYKQAIEKYDGGKYCHIRQLEAMFDFNIIVH